MDGNFQESINRPLTKHHYDRLSTLFNINWRRGQSLCSISQNGPYSPSWALDPKFLSTLKVPLTEYHYDKPSTLYKRMCRSTQFAEFHKKGHRAHMGPWTKISRKLHTDHLSCIIMTVCQLCLSLTGSGVNHFAIFHKMDPRAHLRPWTQNFCTP